MCSPHVRSGELCFTLLRAQYMHILFGILCTGNLSLLPIHSFIISHLFMSVWAHEYSFYTLGYNQILLYFVAKIVLVLTTGSSFSSSWLIPVSVCVRVCVLTLTFRRCKDILLESAISPKSPGSCLWRIVLETKICVLDILASRCSQLTD